MVENERPTSVALTCCAATNSASLTNSGCATAAEITHSPAGLDR